MDKAALLQQLKSALASGIVNEDEVRSLLTPAAPTAPPAAPAVAAPPPAKTSGANEKLSAVEVMFYIAGIVLFVSIMSMIAQTWEDGNAGIHILLSAGVGLGLWALAYRLHRQPNSTDIRKGLTNAIILTGSLCTIVGGFIITNELIGGFQEVNYIPGAVTFALLGALHLAYDRLVRKDLTVLLGILLSVATFPALLFGILQDSGLSFDVWSVVFIASALLLAFATRVYSRLNANRNILGSDLGRAFDPLAAFLSLAVMFGSSFGEYGIIWLMLLIVSVFGLFYLSIVTQNKHLLGNASFFLVLTVLTISFRYFSGAGITVSLVIATLGLLGSAAVATTINKRYFKPPAAEPRPAD